MKIRNIGFIMAAAAVLLGACSDDKDTPTPEPQLPDNPSERPEGKVYTPEEGAAFVQSVSSELQEKYNAGSETRCDVVDLAEYFCDNYGDLKLPGQFSGSNGSSATPFSLLDFFTHLLAGLTDGNCAELSQGIYSYTFNVNFARFAGIFEPEGTQWVKTGDSESIIFKFRDMAGRDCALTATASDFTASDIANWETWQYDPTTGKWSTITFAEIFKTTFSIPRRVDVTLTAGGKDLLSGYTATNLDLKAMTLSHNAGLTVGNLSVTSDLTGSDTQLSEVQRLTVQGIPLITNTITATGFRLLSLTDIEKTIQQYLSSGRNDWLDQLMKGVTAEINVLDKLQISGNFTVNAKLMNALMANLIFDNRHYADEAQAQAACQKAVDVLNQYVATIVRFNKTSNPQAVVMFNVGQLPMKQGFCFYIDPIIKFANGSTVNFDTQIAKGAALFGQLLQQLVTGYQQIWSR